VNRQRSLCYTGQTDQARGTPKPFQGC
jgi:hypothetical protein